MDNNISKNYIKILEENENNIVVNFESKNKIIIAINNINNFAYPFGYLVIENFKVSENIKTVLNIENDLALMISKLKIKEIINIHKVSPENIFCAVEKATTNPLGIIYDSNRNSYQFGVDIDEENYRVVIEFDVVPKGIQEVKANILTSVFKEKRYKNRLQNIKKGNIDKLFLVYEGEK